MKSITEKDIKHAVRQALNEAFGIPFFVEPFVDFIIAYSEHTAENIKNNYPNLYNDILKNEKNAKYISPIGVVNKDVIKTVCPEFAKLYPFDDLKIWVRGGADEGAVYKDNLFLSCKFFSNNLEISLKQVLMHEFTHIINLRKSDGVGMPVSLGTKDFAIGFADMTCYLFQDTEMNARIGSFWEELQGAIWHNEYAMKYPNESAVTTYIDILVNGCKSLQMKIMDSIIKFINRKNDKKIDLECFSFDTFKQEFTNNGKGFILSTNYYWHVYKKVAKTRSNDVFRLPSIETFSNMWAKNPEEAYNTIVRLIDSQIMKKYAAFKKRAYRVAYEYYAQQTDEPKMTANDLLRKIFGDSQNV